MQEETGMNYYNRGLIKKKNNAINRCKVSYSFITKICRFAF